MGISYQPGTSGSVIQSLIGQDITANRYTATSTTGVAFLSGVSDGQYVLRNGAGWGLWTNSGSDTMNFACGSGGTTVFALTSSSVGAYMPFSSTVASGSNAITFTAAGARLKFSSGGTTDYFSSDGNTVISAAGNFTAATLGSSGTNTLSGGTPLNLTSATASVFFNSTAATAGIIFSGISAANAGATATTAAVKIEPINVLDAADWLFSVNTQSSAASLFNVSYQGDVTLANNLKVGGIVRFGGQAVGGITTGTIAGGGNGNGSYYQSNASDAPGASMHRFTGANTFTAGADRFLADFYSDNASTVRARISSDGTYQTQMGTGTGFSLAPGVANVNSSVVGSGADTTEDNLMTYSLPANSLAANNKGLRITAWGDGVSTADVTTVRCYFGATVVVSKVLTASQANTWKAVFEVIRTGATTQIATGVLNNGGTAASSVQSNASPGETLSGAVTIKCTGQRATSSVANSVRQLGMIVEVIN